MVKLNSKQKQLIENNALGLATVNEDGSPHVIAVGYCKVVGVNRILATDNYMRETTENILKNNLAAVAVWNSDWQTKCEGYEFSGKADYFTKGKWFDKVRALKENQGEPCRGAILITINKIKRLA